MSRLSKLMAQEALLSDDVLLTSLVALADLCMPMPIAKLTDVQQKRLLKIGCTFDLTVQLTPYKVHARLAFDNSECAYTLYRCSHRQECKFEQVELASTSYHLAELIQDNIDLVRLMHLTVLTIR